MRRDLWRSPCPSRAESKASTHQAAEGLLQSGVHRLCSASGHRSAFSLLHGSAPSRALRRLLSGPVVPAGVPVLCSVLEGCCGAYHVFPLGSWAFHPQICVCAMPTDFHWDLKHLYIFFTLSLSAPRKSVPERKSRLTCHVLETRGITKVGNFHFGDLWFL